nr:type VII secretion integral membrane protein EccD [uncultured Corynebacterium sp.]
MTTINASHTLRLTVRIELFDASTSIDLAIPASSSLSETIDEILAIANLPTNTTPWCATTAAGQELDPAIPLAQCHLTQGDILVISPLTETPTPVVRDAAELLENLTQATPPPIGTVFCAGLAGLLGLTLLVAALPGLPPILRLIIPVVATLAMLLWTRKLLFAPITVGGVSLTTLIAIAGSPTLPTGAQMSDSQFARMWALACACAGIILIVSTLLLRFITPHVPTISALITIGISLIIMALGACFYHPPLIALTDPTWSWLVHSAALVVAAGIIALAFSPLLSIKIAGVRVPQLPTSGQDLSISDTNPTNTPHRALLAQHILDGITVGLGCVLSPAIIVICGWAPQRNFSFALAVCMCLSLVVHAHRHHGSPRTWSLWIPAMAAACGTALSASPHLIDATAPPAHLGLSIAAFLVSATVFTAPGWVKHLTNLEPTTVVWVERAELLSIAACLPLALHLVGIFSLLRGIAL